MYKRTDNNQKKLVRQIRIRVHQLFEPTFFECLKKVKAKSILRKKYRDYFIHTVSGSFKQLNKLDGYLWMEERIFSIQMEKNGE